MQMNRQFLTLLAMALVIRGAQAEDDLPDIHLSGLLDLRAIHTDETTSWLDYGLGKNRYGGETDEARSFGQIAEAAVIAHSRFTWSTSGKLYLKYDADQEHPVDLVEGFIAYQPVATGSYKFTSRVGAFFPPLSFENTGPAWTSPYSITPSAINTWVGEELRTLGGEGTLQWLGDGQKIGFTGALYKANDPTGSLLAWRGWALHDFKTGLNDRVPLAPTHSIGPDGDFPKQAPWVEPFHEIDGKWGSYGTLTWEHAGSFKTRALYYDNHGDPTAFNGTQYAWHTRFSSVGGLITLPGDAELIGQYLRGDTLMGSLAHRVDVEFSSWNMLLSKRFDQHQVSLRYDLFDVQDIADVEYNDNDHGHAWTLAYGLDVTKGQRLMLEVLDINSHHPQREDLDLPLNTHERLLQMSYRVYF